MRALIISNKIRKIPGGAVETIINPLMKRGYKITWAANFSTAKFDLSTFPCEILNTKSETNPFSFNNIKTRKIILNYLKNNKTDLIFCSTPIGGLHGRLCGKKAKVKTIIYQAHGFLFFKGGPRLGFVYKLLEKRLAKYTDSLITINNEDYRSVSKFKLRNNSHHVYMVNGSGENYESVQISENKKKELYKELDLKRNDFVFISIGELNNNKNVINTVKAFNKSFGSKDGYKLLICGEGPQETKIRKYINKNGLRETIKLLGYRNDVKELLQISNCYISTSLREGLSRTVGEAMAAGLPCLVSNKRGLSDWMDDESGFVFDPKDIDDISSKMKDMVRSKDLDKISKHNVEKVKDYSSEKVVSQMNKIFDEVL